VITDREVNAPGQKTKGQKRYPYDLHPEYKQRYFALIDARGKYVLALRLTCLGTVLMPLTTTRSQASSIQADSVRPDSSAERATKLGGAG
jgi:hypothetical protein